VSLGLLERVPLREVWNNEAAHFTPWLAQPTNLELLGKALGMELAGDRTEATVGGFSADIVARSATDNSVVLIENQLEQTDHTHLGQILTYLAGLEAKTVVWVAQRIRDEHRAAIEWLNTNTAEAFRFFAIEVELWRISGSPPAPRFNIVVKPNDWARVERAKQAQAPAGEDGPRYLAFWTGFKEWLESASSEARVDRPYRTSNIWVPVPDTPFVLSLYRGKERVGLYVRPASSVKAEQEEVNGQLTELLPELRGRLGVTAPSERDGTLLSYTRSDFADQGAWPEAFRWLGDKVDAYRAAVRDVWSKRNEQPK
jgi:hypothetical protein